MNEDTDKRKLLIIDDEENMRHMLSSLLAKYGYDIDTASDGQEGLSKVKRDLYDFVLCDIKMPRLDGMAFLDLGKEYLSATTVIMMSAYGTIDTAVNAMKLGAYDYISKPFKTDEVRLALKKAEERERLKKENLWLKERIRKIEEDFRFGKMVGASKSMEAVFRLSEKVAQYDTTVLICGESGSGKELIARGIHLESKRAGKAWIPVNCGGVPENLLDSEFFGYKKGAFTGADCDRKGLFESADGGTIFLDEIGELPFSLQVKLLRVLQEKEIRKIGDSRTKKIDVRVLAATSKDLSEEVKKGNFRQDLFFRMNVVQVKLPPLRERKEDIALLSRHFLDKFNKRFGKSVVDISSSAMSKLFDYSWPGNVRELKNCIERALILSEGESLSEDAFPSEIRGVSKGEVCQPEFGGFSLKKARRIWERKLIVKALDETGGNRTKASRLLEISHPSLLNKIKDYEIDA